MGFGGLVLVGFTRLIFFSPFLSPQEENLEILGLGLSKNQKEMKMAGTMTAEKGWPKRGLVEDSRSEHGGCWLWVWRSSVWFVRKFGKINENEVVDVVIKLKDLNPIFKSPVWFIRNFVVANLMGKSSNKLFIYLGHIGLNERVTN